MNDAIFGADFQYNQNPNAANGKDENRVNRQLNELLFDYYYYDDDEYAQERSDSKNYNYYYYDDEEEYLPPRFYQHDSVKDIQVLASQVQEQIVKPKRQIGKEDWDSYLINMVEDEKKTSQNETDNMDDKTDSSLDIDETENEKQNVSDSEFANDHSIAEESNLDFQESDPIPHSTPKNVPILTPQEREDSIQLVPTENITNLELAYEENKPKLVTQENETKPQNSTPKETEIDSKDSETITNLTPQTTETPYLASEKQETTPNSVPFEAPTAPNLPLTPTEMGILYQGDPIEEETLWPTTLDPLHLGSVLLNIKMEEEKDEGAFSP